ncbi:MaoC family dehydratase N-terminal domain-containing protein [Actinotalea ferrariae]|uniref:FAS1-like dehydratase domain-containing protein n=1 Tax=Actinotalea ferrariae TaxID=1386098 RepID=UPI001C8B8A46|nr:MaoC family dehydratase N-terminal domain-containing protein [Actinotalea ferrariae]MBX9244927.1 MaoC family dehydratase N-terminal domain-containing protein [Actinotalea ferrariae]
MGINPAYAGREYPPTAPYVVGREHVRDFARAVGATHPAHHDADAARALGHPDVVAPPTFAVVVAQRAEAQLIADPEAAIDFSRVVHADERITHHRPVHAGDELVTVLHIDAVVERSGLATVTTRCEISDVAGAPVSTVVSRLAVRLAEEVPA